MKIEGKSTVDLKTLQPGQIINKLGQYLYKNIDSAYTFEKSPETYDIYFDVDYQMPIHLEYPEDEILYENEIETMKIVLSLTHYDDKIRVNIIQLDEYEPTIAHKTYKIEDLKTLVYARTTIVKLINDSLTKYFKDYKFLFY